jgi:uncharacterized protein
MKNFVPWKISYPSIIPLSCRTEDSMTIGTTIGLLALGLITGSYGTLIGAGGGFVLLPALLLLYPHENPEILTSISLAVVFFNALSGTEAYALMKRVDYKTGFLFAAATLPGAVLGALATSLISRGLFDAILGCLMISAAVYLLFKNDLKRRKSRQEMPRQGFSRTIVEADGTSHTYSFNPVLGMAISFVVGFFSSLLGIGGGIIHVPVLVYLLNFPVHIATATSHFILANMALAGTMTHLLTGTFSHGLYRTIFLAIGVVVGAQLGARLSNRVGGTWIIKSLAAALGVAGIRILIQAWSG